MTMAMQSTTMAGEVVWITGASSGIGRELARQMAAAGATVIASARREASLQALTAEPGDIRALPFDVTDASALDQVRDRLRDMTHYLDRAIFNAGTCEYLDIHQPDWDMMRRVMATNYFGLVNSLAVAMPLLQQQPEGRGHIVGVASQATFAPFARAEAYGASKAATQYFLDALRADLHDTGMDVTVINPGFVKTPLTERNDFAMPFLMPVDRAAARMLTAIQLRRRQCDFPRRLKWMLNLLSVLPAVWYKLVTPALSRGRTGDAGGRG